MHKSPSQRDLICGIIDEVKGRIFLLGHAIPILGDNLVKLRSLDLETATKEDISKINFHVGQLIHPVKCYECGNEEYEMPAFGVGDDERTICKECLRKALDL
jgi:hypothetical protein